MAVMTLHQVKPKCSSELLTLGMERLRAHTVWFYKNRKNVIYAEAVRMLTQEILKASGVQLDGHRKAGPYRTWKGSLRE